MRIALGRRGPFRCQWNLGYCTSICSPHYRQGLTTGLKCTPYTLEHATTADAGVVDCLVCLVNLKVLSRSHPLKHSVEKVRRTKYRQVNPGHLATWGRRQIANHPTFLSIFPHYQPNPLLRLHKVSTTSLPRDCTSTQRSAAQRSATQCRSTHIPTRSRYTNFLFPSQITIILGVLLGSDSTTAPIRFPG